MRALSHRKSPGLVVGRDARQAEIYATSLSRCDLAPICFDDCAQALLWLEEDTPTAAVVMEGDPALPLLLTTLADRDVAVVKPRNGLLAAK